MRPWREAMRVALYGPGGYYVAGRGAGGFRTSAGSPPFAAALARLAAEVDVLLGGPDPVDLVDVGAADGRLLLAVAAAAPADLRRRLRLTGVDLRPRPAGLPAGLRWAAEVRGGIVGLLIANEWLDVVPLDVVEGGRLVLVDLAGRERPGPPPDAVDVAWLDTWWPGWPTERAEVGRGRDEAWAAAVGNVGRGLAVAVDYAHTRRSRPPQGTLTGYRDGRPVPPVPDGSCDLTAHVALDACAAVAAATGATVLTTQRAGLRALGVTGTRPPYRGKPEEYLAELAGASQEGELIAPGGLGGFGWLAQAVGIPLPPSLRGV